MTLGDEAGGAAVQNQAARAAALHFYVLSTVLSFYAKLLQSCPTLCDPIDGNPTRLRHPWDPPGKDTGVGCHFLLQLSFYIPYICVNFMAAVTVHMWRWRGPSGLRWVWRNGEKEMATHSSVLAWRIPGMAEPGGLPSMG